MAEHKSVYEAVVAIMSEVNFVDETGTVSSRGGSYKYASDLDIIRAIRPAMINHDVVMFPVASAMAEPESFTTSGGSVWSRIRIAMTYRFYHAPSDTFFDAQIVGEGADPGDKAAYKANTGAQKYALRQVFTIPVGGDDPDKENADTTKSNTTRGQSSSKGAAPKSAPKSKSAPKAESKTQPAEKFDSAKMNKAIEYAVPEGAPLAGMKLSKVQQDTEVGPIVLLWLAGLRKSPKGEMFEPTEEDKPVMGAARYIVDFSPTFQKSLEVFKTNNPELFAE